MGSEAYDQPQLGQWVTKPTLSRNGEGRNSVGVMASMLCLLPGFVHR